MERYLTVVQPVLRRRVGCEGLSVRSSPTIDECQDETRWRTVRSRAA